MPTVHLLGNPSAGGGRRSGTFDDVVARVERAGHDVVRLDAATRADALALAHRAVAEGATRLVVVGGDGLVHLAVQAVAATSVVLGIVPIGTGNDFARALGLDATDPRAAIETALDDATPCDAIRTTHGWVASVATLGFSGAVNERANRLRYPRGSARYTVATLLELPRLKPVTLTLELDGAERVIETTILAIANTAQFGGGMAICPDASPHDGRLDIAVIGPVARRTLLRVLPRVFKGTHVSHPACTMLSARCLRITGASAPALWGDGEPLGTIPVEIEAVPDALHIAGASAANTDRT